MPQPYRPPPALPPFPTTDAFGLPMLSLLAEASETPEERTKRVVLVRRVAFRFYRTVVEHLGEEGRELFRGFAARRRGRERGPTDTERDGELLARVDACLKEATSEAERDALPRLLSEALHKESGGCFGNSPSAIEKHIRGLLKLDRRGGLKAAQKAIEASRRRPLSDPWPEPGPNRVPDTK